MHTRPRRLAVTYWTADARRPAPTPSTVHLPPSSTASPCDVADHSRPSASSNELWRASPGMPELALRSLGPGTAPGTRYTPTFVAIHRLPLGPSASAKIA